MKVAISLPDPVFDAAEQLARQRKVSRSQLYAEALSAYVGERGAAAVTEKLDAVYANAPSHIDKALSEMQSRSLGHHAAW